jgi:hydrogenase maturation protease
MPPTIKLIATGNECRRDDGAGFAVLRKLQPYLSSHVQTAIAANVTDLVDLWRGADVAYVFDAIEINAVKSDAVKSDAANLQSPSKQSPSKMLYRIAAHEQPLPSSWSSHSTHGIGVAEMVELARALNQLPPQLYIYGIRGMQFGMGYGLSPNVERAVDELVPHMIRELNGKLEDKSETEP